MWPACGAIPSRHSRESVCRRRRSASTAFSRRPRVWVVGPEGVRTSRRHYRLLGLRGTLSQQGHALINGHPWKSPEALALVKRAAGDDAWLEASDAHDRFDVLPLLVATDGAVAAFGRDVRRLRPNILIGGVDGLAERDWPGAELHIGSLIVRLDSSGLGAR